MAADDHAFADADKHWEDLLRRCRHRDPLPVAARRPVAEERWSQPVDQPVRVDDRVRSPHQPQRQTLAVRRDGAALDGRRDLEAENQFRRIIGYRDLAKLAVAIERDLGDATIPSPTEEAAILVTA